MAIMPGAPRAADFTDPLGMLRDCHRRVERFLGAQVKVAACDPAGPLDTLHADGARQAAHYFQTNAPWHTQDEEDSLFPRLRASSHPSAARAVALADALEADHVEMAPLHDVVDEAIDAWLSDGRLDARQHARLNAVLATMHTVYTAHIAREDDELLPLAAEVLRPQDLVEMGREMRVRRGLAGAE